MSAPEGSSWARVVRDHRIPHRPVDAPTAALLEHMSGDPNRLHEVLTVCEAIAHTARDHGGAVDMNHVRSRLWDPLLDRYSVKPQLIGSVVSALARHGQLTVTGVGLNTDRRGGNHGKPQRLYHLDVPPDPFPHYRRRHVLGVDDPDPDLARADYRASDPTPASPAHAREELEGVDRLW